MLKQTYQYDEWNPLTHDTDSDTSLMKQDLEDANKTFRNELESYTLVKRQGRRRGRRLKFEKAPKIQK